MINFEFTLSIGDLIATIGLLLAAVGLFLNWSQMRKDSTWKRAEFIIHNFYQYLLDPDSADMFYRLEYGKFVYTRDFHGSPEEIKLDKLLRYFERIAALYEMGTISLADLALVEYEFSRINQDPAVQEYFAFLDDWSKQRRVKRNHFDSLRRVARLLEKS